MSSPRLSRLSFLVSLCDCCLCPFANIKSRKGVGVLGIEDWTPFEETGGNEYPDILSIRPLRKNGTPSELLVCGFETSCGIIIGEIGSVFNRFR